jgi:hypothetical protein
MQHQFTNAELGTFILIAVFLGGFAMKLWDRVRGKKVAIDQPFEVRIAKEFASKKSVEALFAMHRSLRAEFEQKMAEQRDEIMAAIDKNRAEQREDNRQIFDLIRDLSASTRATAAIVESINRKISP